MQIGGPAGVFIVIVYGIVERYIPVSIVVGFTNGIVVPIALSQVKDLLGLHPANMPADFFGQIQTLWACRQQFNPHALGLGQANVLPALPQALARAQSLLTRPVITRVN